MFCLCVSLAGESPWVFCPCVDIKWPKRRLCLFSLWAKVSSPLWWMSVAWEHPNCPIQQCVFILAWPLAQVAHSNSGPLAQSPKTMRCCRASSQSHCGPSPGAGVFSDKFVPDLLSELNCFFVVSSMWMSVWLSCGFVDSLCSDTLHGFHQDTDSAACLPLSHDRRSFIRQQLSHPQKKLIFERLMWSMKYKFS